MFATKLTGKIPDTRNAEEKFIFYLKRKKIKAIRKTEKAFQVGTGKISNSTLYSKTKKWEFFERERCKSNKTSRWF